MKNIVCAAVLASLTIFAASCSDGTPPESRTAGPSSLPAISKDEAVSSEAVISNKVSNEEVAPINDPARKIIKTADFRCRVADVFTATTRIERLAASLGGGVSSSMLENTIDASRAQPSGTDSLRQIESYTTTAHVTLRVPVSKLDTVLSDIAAGASFINSRSLHLDDVTLRYLGNKLKADALASNNAATRAQQLARRSADAVASGEYTDNRNENRIDKRIEGMQLAEDAAFATLTVDLYQPQRIAVHTVPDIDALIKPAFGQRVGEALGAGWHILQALLVGLLAIWPLLLLSAIGILLYRRFAGRRRTLRGFSASA